ncbi:MAG: hypothetical protein HY865_20320 [Chloroflexi bacterium]|nr:hypothetical protein [Chloroflexota bacterium]
MKLEDLNNYPEYPEIEVVEQFCNLVLDQAETVMIEETLGNLRCLGDKQWHTYKIPSETLRERVKAWLVYSGVLDSMKYLEDVLVIAFYFCLDKEFYKNALERYTGMHQQEFARSLENSTGKIIDPWWSLKCTSANHQP